MQIGGVKAPIDGVSRQLPGIPKDLLRMGFCAVVFDSFGSCFLLLLLFLLPKELNQQSRMNNRRLIF